MKSIFDTIKDTSSLDVGITATLIFFGVKLITKIVVPNSTTTE